MNLRDTFFRLALPLGAALLSFGTIHAQNFDRIVLLEEFTSATCLPCVEATPIVNRAVSDGDGRVVSVRYHLNAPFPNDPWYVANPTANDARRTYYNVTGIPNARVGGDLSLNPINESQVKGAITNKLATRAPIKLTVTQTRNGNEVTVSVAAEAGPQGLTGNYKLRIAAVESFIHVENLNIDHWNNEKVFYDVFRSLVPTADGQALQLTANQKRTLTATYTLGQDWQVGEMFAVAWVQNDISKEIVQSGFSTKLVAAGIHESSSLAGYALEQTIPNPATAGEVSIPYLLASSEEVTITMHDAVGRQVGTIEQGRREPGRHIARVDVAALLPGVYTYTITAGEFRATRQMVIVR